MTDANQSLNFFSASWRLAKGQYIGRDLSGDLSGGVRCHCRFRNLRPPQRPDELPTARLAAMTMTYAGECDFTHSRTAWLTRVCQPLPDALSAAST